MKLSHSAQYVPARSSRLRFESQYRKNNESEQYLFNDKQPENIKIVIKINKNQQLQPSFIDTFSKIISNTNIDFQEFYGDIKEITYSQFYQNLRNLGQQINRSRHWRDCNKNLFNLNLNLKPQQKGGFKKAKSHSNIRKGSVDLLLQSPNKRRNNYQFIFEAHNNSIVLLLDLSPYMLLYDYSSKSFVLQNMQQIVRDLFVGLQRHYNQKKVANSGPAYFVSCYGFSVYKSQIQEIMKDQQIFFTDSHESKFKNKDLISDYICAYINRSNFPHSPFNKQKQKIIPISQIIQKVLNLQEGNSGIKSFITISAFKQLDTNPYIFFSCNWYTYCFIFAGQLNFGSYLIDTRQIINKFSKSPYLDTKFVYKCKFLQNWEKVQLIQRQMREGNRSTKNLKSSRFTYLDKSLQKTRAILYIQTNGQRKESIFDSILKFDIKINSISKKVDGTIKSNDSIALVSRSQKYLSQYQFNIPVQYISEIMRTKYLQGWQQISTQNYLQNTKYVFKLQFSNRTGIIYNATRTQDYFNVKVSFLSNQNDSGYYAEKLRGQIKHITETIKKVDIINTQNFDIVTSFKNKNTAHSDRKMKSNKHYQFQLDFDTRSYQRMNLLNQIITKHDQWSCYFKVRRIYIEFSPNKNFLNDLNQLLNQFGFILGERISHLSFMYRKERKEKLIDNIKQRQISRWNIIFVKVTGILHFLEFKFGFLKFSDNQIKQVIENIENKFITKKLMNGSVKLIPQEIYNYCIQKFYPSNIIYKNLPSVYQKNWKVSFKNQYLFKIFKYANRKIIRKLGYKFLCNKNGTIYYCKILNVLQKQTKKDKSIFLQIVYQSQNNSILFKLQAFPSFNYIQNKASSSIIESNASEKNINYTQKSISSSSGQHSIISGSLPCVSTIKQVGVTRTNPITTQPKFKNSYIQLFNILVTDLKQSQKKFINMIKYEAQIYDILLKKRIQQKKSGLQNQQLILQIKQIYQIHSGNFQIQYLSIVSMIKRQFYNQQAQEINMIRSSKRSNLRNAYQNYLTLNNLSQINIDQIPQPKQYLMQSQILNIKGDLTLKSKTNPQKSYTFFLLTPNKVIYVWKRYPSERIYFRIYSNVYSHFLPIYKGQIKLDKIFKNQLINRINKQFSEEKYLSFYNLISQNKNDSCLIKHQLKKTKGNKGNQNITIRDLIEYSQVILTSFNAININCSQIINILCKEEFVNLQQRLIKVLMQFRDKFFYYLSIFFEKSNLVILDQNVLGVQNLDQGKNKSRQSSKSSSFTNQTSQQQIKELKKQFQYVDNQKLNNYYFERKYQQIEQKFISQFNITDSEYCFQNLVLKISCNKGVPITQDNFIQIFTNKSKNIINSNMMSQNQKMQIHLDIFGGKLSKSSSKIKMLSKIISELLTQCIIYLQILTVTDLNNIKKLEAKLCDFIVKGPSWKIPDDLWNQVQITRQIQSGHMQTLIPFYQYSHKPFTVKFIARQQQIMPHSFNKSKFNKILYLKYWLTLQITPAQVLKTRIIPFNHLSLMTEVILNFSQQKFKDQLQKIINSYIQQIIKQLKIRNIFKSILRQLKFPQNPPLPIYINKQIHQKLLQQKKKYLKVKVPVKFKLNNFQQLELKSLSSSPDCNFVLGFNQQNTPLSASSNINSSSRASQNALTQNLPHDDSHSLKNYIHIPLIIQGSISYFLKFEPEEIFNLIFNNEKLNSFAVRNLKNTYIFYNSQVKQYFIFYLEQYKQEKSYDLRIKYPSLLQKPKKNCLIYSVYCIDQTVSKTVAQKYHVQLIKKVLQQATFYKIATNLFLCPSIIDQPEEQYLKQGQKKKISFQIPHIQLKSNFRQYLKQHMQNYFVHKKTDFKTLIKKRQAQKNSDSQVIRHNSSNKEIKISSKKTKIDPHRYASQCQKRCVSQNWLFNTVNNQKLQQNFGRCLFLVQFNVNDSFYTAQNAIFWSRNIRQKQNSNQKKLTYIYAKINQKQSDKLSSSQEECQQIDNIFKYLKKFEYIQTSQKKNLKVDRLQSHSSMKSKQSQKNFETKKNERNSNNLAIFENQKFTTVTFNIFSAFGYPKYNAIQKIYRELIYYSLLDYYLQFRLFKQLFSNFNLSITKSKVNRQFSLNFKPKSKDQAMLKQDRRKNSQSEQQCYKSLIIPTFCRIQSSPATKSSHSSIKKQSFVLIYNDQFVNQVYRSLISILRSIQSQIPLKKTTCVNYYQTENNLLIENKISVLVSFLKDFVQMFNKIFSKTNETYSIRIVVYGIDFKNQQYFWGLEYQKSQQKQKDRCKFSASLQQIQQDIQKYNYQFKKMGLFFYDSLLDIDSLRQTFFLKDQDNDKTNSQNREWETFNRVSEKFNIQFQWMKKFNQGYSFCQTNYYYRRSLITHFQLSDSDFLCYFYNFQDINKQFNHLIHHLQQLQYWFSQKYRLYTFISKLKRCQNYEDYYQLPPQTKQNSIRKHKIGETLQGLVSYMKGIDKEQKHTQMQFNLTKLLKSLVFDLLPFKNFSKSKMAISKMYKILSCRKIPYSSYPDYKGKQKSKLEKLGRQYLTILQDYFGTEKIQRKQSTINANRENKQKNVQHQTKQNNK